MTYLDKENWEILPPNKLTIEGILLNNFGAHIYAIEYYTAIKMNVLWLHVYTFLNFENISLVKIYLE